MASGIKVKQASQSSGEVRSVNKDAVRQRQELGNKVNQNNLDTLVKAMFDKFDVDNSGTVSETELEKGLAEWGIKMSKANWQLLLETFPDAKSANLAQFKSILIFFLKIRQNFTKYDKDASNTISLKELPEFLLEFSLVFEEEVLKDLVSLWHDEGNQDLTFSNVVELMLYLYKLHQLFSAEDKDKSGALDPAELQALLRSMNIHVSVLELKVFFERLNFDPTDNLNFRKFVSLLFKIKKDLEEIRKEARKVRKENRGTVDKSTRIQRKLDKKLPKNLKKKIKKQKEEFKELVQKCEESGKKYEDPDFPCDPSLYFPKKGPNFASFIKSWKRIEDFPGGTLFVDGVDQGDVKQGHLGDCWFLSSLCVLAGQTPDALKNLFIETSPKHGIVACRFFKNGEWHFTIIDDKIPCGANGKPCFASSRDEKELWVPLLEKAFAKMHGNFEAIESGSITDGLVDLTGDASEVIDIGKTDDFWKLLVEYSAEGHLMGCAAQSPTAKVEEATPLGIMMLHAYGILKVVEVEGIKLICIRNPWGRYEWKGRWSDESKEWTPSLIEKLNVKFGDDGVFWMEFSDFTKQFNKLYVLRVLTDELGHVWKRFDFIDEWKGESAGGCLNNPTWKQNPQFHIKSEEDTKIFVSLCQPDLRIAHKRTPVYKPIGFAVLIKGDTNSNEKKTRVTKADLIKMTAFPTVREISGECSIKAGVDYVIIPSFFEKGAESKFYLSIYTHSHNVVVNHIGKEKKEKEKETDSDSDSSDDD